MSPEDDMNEPASPPCYQHEFVADAGELHGQNPPWDQVKAWRRVQRERLIAARLNVDPRTREDFADKIADIVRREIGSVRDAVISFYWPMRGEPDLRPLMVEFDAWGTTCVLPVVEKKARPLKFRIWRPDTPLEKGFWNIPVPATKKTARPDILLAPVVGYDARCYRLGYGGGYFDRTLAKLGHSARPFGVGYAAAELGSIYPQPHDVPLNAIFTEAGVRRPA